MRATYTFSLSVDHYQFVHLYISKLSEHSYKLWLLVFYKMQMTALYSAIGLYPSFCFLYMIKELKKDVENTQP